MGLDDDGDEGTVVSLNPVLDFVLRDPPGDASYAGISQGSSVNLSREIATDWEEGRGFSNALKTSPVLSSSNGFSVGFGYTKEFEVEVDVEISVGDYEYAMDYSATGRRGLIRKLSSDSSRRLWEKEGTEQNQNLKE